MTTWRNLVCLTIGLLALSSAAYPCTCVTLTPDRAFQQAAAIFPGTVIKVVHLRTLTAPDPVSKEMRTWIPETDDLLMVTFGVDGVWKGPVRQTITVITVARPNDCDGYGFGLASDYLVYADSVTSAYPELPKFRGQVDYEIGLCPLPIAKVSLDVATRRLGKPQR